MDPSIVSPLRENGVPKADADAEAIADRSNPHHDAAVVSLYCPHLWHFAAPQSRRSSLASCGFPSSPPSA
ncbi:hypothetical protein [Phormidium sp. CCY1219]|uniref:hypothetical protein n=1 Tax=Phormidium sp. CCY1219 TaxID=2886104 RepID=UPI002D1E95AB|nr:hypothetical protein [Phormidium sp. CCY1219]MEB3826544.1 hypothetical protein [Phormidium sp. CCY1219]